MGKKQVPVSWPLLFDCVAIFFMRPTVSERLKQAIRIREYYMVLLSFFFFFWQVCDFHAGEAISVNSLPKSTAIHFSKAGPLFSLQCKLESVVRSSISCYSKPSINRYRSSTPERYGLWPDR